MSFLRGIDSSDDPSARGNRTTPFHEEQRRAIRRDVLGTGTLACPRCDAPVSTGGRSRSLTEPLRCPYCDAAGAVREFLSLSVPTRPARVVIRVVGRRISRG